MPRPKSPDGRRVHENVMLSEAEAALIDLVRGQVKRGPWIREAALEAARSCQRCRENDSGILETPGVGITVDCRQPPGIVSVASRGEEATEVRSFALAPEPDAKPCKHKGLKLSKGVCPDCQQWAVKS